MFVEISLSLVKAIDEVDKKVSHPPNTYRQDPRDRAEESARGPKQVTQTMSLFFFQS